MTDETPAPRRGRIIAIRVYDIGFNVLAIVLMSATIYGALNPATSFVVTTIAAEARFSMTLPGVLAGSVLWVVGYWLLTRGLDQGQWKTPLMRGLDVVAFGVLVVFTLVVPGLMWLFWILAAAVALLVVMALLGKLADILNRRADERTMAAYVSNRLEDPVDETPEA